METKKRGKDNFFRIVLLCSLLMAAWALLILVSTAKFYDSNPVVRQINETHVSVITPESVSRINSINSAESVIVVIGSLIIIFIIGWQISAEKKLQKAGIAVLIYLAVFLALYYLVFLFLKKPFLLANI